MFIYEDKTAVSRESSCERLIASLGVSADTLAALAGGVRLIGLQKIGRSSRNPLWRISIEGGVHPTAVLKLYRRETDQFFDHRFRREEKILTLLNRWAPDMAPLLYGGWISSGRSASLLIEDLGSELLDEALLGASAPRRKLMLAQAIDSLTNFQAITLQPGHFVPLFRTCYSVDLDRLTLTAYSDRLAIALRRILGTRRLARADPDQMVSGAVELPALHNLLDGRAWRTLRRLYRDAIARLLVRGPRCILHNSFSPLNLMLHAGRIKLIDFETVSLGPPQVDLAELLVYPRSDLSETSIEHLIERYLAAIPLALRDSLNREPTNFCLLFDCAAISRTLDYVGTLSLRHRSAQNAGLCDVAADAEARRDWYLRLLWSKLSKRPALSALHDELRKVLTP